MDESGDGFDLMLISKPEICVWNILRYALRIWNGKKKEHDMEKYIKEKTVEKYKMDETGGGFDLMSISKPEICVWNILRYALRMWNGKKKEHDLEKIAHYAEMAWTMSGGDHVEKVVAKQL